MISHSITFTGMETIRKNRNLIEVIAFMMVIAMGCKRDTPTPEPKSTAVKPVASEVLMDYDTSLWKEITDEDGFVIDVKYATTDNFTGEVIYPCGRMFLRPEVVKALFQIRDEILPQGYRLKLFDGYRPRPAQQKLWDKVPDRNYVAPPSEGSMHNRGVAIDLSLTDLKGNEINMGTPYDFFGPEAHHDYNSLSPEKLEHRKKLKSVMESHGFQAIRTEWWHYSYGSGSYPLDDWQWPCED